METFSVEADKSLFSKKNHSLLRELQLQEIEMISNMYKDEVKEIKGVSEYKNDRKFLTPFSVCLIFMEYTSPYEIHIEVPIDYPKRNVIPLLSIFSNYLSQKSSKLLYQNLREQIEALAFNDDFKIIPLIQWINANITTYIQQDPIDQPKIEKILKDNALARYWIYSHHIYNMEKRKNIMAETKDAGLTGFVLPGKPGIICVEGYRDLCQQFWVTIKSWNWQKIVIKHEEHSDGKKERDKFQLFKNFQELNFNRLDLNELVAYEEKLGCNVSQKHMVVFNKPSTSNKHNKFHNDKGQFAQYLKMHNCEYIIPILFNLN